MTEWTQKALEDIFLRKDLYEAEQEDFERRMTRIEGLLEWFQKLVLTQGVILVVAIIMFVVERVSP